MINISSSQLADFSDLVGPLQPSTPAEKDSARRHAAEHAIDAADLAMLLDAMGLS